MRPWRGSRPTDGALTLICFSVFIAAVRAFTAVSRATLSCRITGTSAWRLLPECPKVQYSMVRHRGKRTRSSTSMVSKTCNPGPHRELEQLRLGIDQQLDEGQATRGRRFNTSGGKDCARLLHGGSFAVRRVASGCPPLVYHEH